MKFKIGDHLQETGTTNWGIVVDTTETKGNARTSFITAVAWYQIENSELDLINHWVPERKLELHKQTLRDNKIDELLK